MKLRVKTGLTIRPDRRGEYPDVIAERLIRFGLAERLTPRADHDDGKRSRGKK
jgi:hypothetical protein